MIKNMLYSFLFIDLIIAISILVVWQSEGISPHYVRFGSSIISFFNSLSREFNASTIAIPKVPDLDEVPYLEPFQNNWLIINFFVYLLNSFLNVLNLVIFFINCVFDSLKFFFILFTNFNAFVDLIKSL